MTYLISIGVHIFIHTKNEKKISKDEYFCIKNLYYGLYLNENGQCLKMLPLEDIYQKDISILIFFVRASNFHLDTMFNIYTKVQ
jgi:hypothetical protein